MELSTQKRIKFFCRDICHEVGHYLGLFHPVEDDFSTWDALGTVECLIKPLNKCFKNFMFPYPV